MANADTTFQKLIELEEVVLEFRSFADLLVSCGDGKQPNGDAVHWFLKWAADIQDKLYPVMESYHQQKKGADNGAPQS